MLFIRFLSTPSARRATRKEHSIAYRVTISIHALREEGDGGFDVTVSLAGNFYPRPPRGGRPSKAGGRQRLFDISIHALREEGDSKLEPISSLFSYFYPRPPRGGRLLAIREIGSRTSISIHALREEGDLDDLSAGQNRLKFLSTPSARRATFSPASLDSCDR